MRWPESLDKRHIRLDAFVFAALMCAYGVLVGAAAALGVDQKLLFILFPLALLILAAFWQMSGQSVIVAFITMHFLGLYLFGAIQGILGISIVAAWQIPVFVVGAYGLVSFIQINKKEPILVAAFWLMLGYFALAIISALLTGVNSKAFLFQMASNCKLVAALGFFWAISSRIDLEKIFLIFTPIVLAAAVLALGAQWVSPGAYLSVFKNFRIPYEATSILPSPGLSVFSHPSILAGVTAGFCAFYLCRWLLSKRKIDLFIFVVSLGLLFSSNQRQEIFAFLVVSVVIIFYVSNKSVFFKVFAVSTVASCALVMYGYLYFESFQREASLWGVGTFSNSTIPRYQLYEAAFDLAARNFPLGQGLGSYGGVGAMKYDLSVFYEMGFASEWWWPDYQSYILDAYWPNIIGEGGYFAAAMLVFYYIFICFYLFRKGAASLEPRVRMLWYASGGGILWLLLTTPTSPGFQEMAILYLPCAFWIMALRSEHEGRKK